MTPCILMALALSFFNQRGKIGEIGRYTRLGLLERCVIATSNSFNHLGRGSVGSCRVQSTIKSFNKILQQTEPA